MASVIRSNVKEPAEPGASSQESMAADVQSYLISNYREALKNGDKSAAKSCLLAARYFSVNDPNVTNEIYIMAKSDGDVSEASKCFANIFNDLFVSSEQNSPKTNTSEQLAVINQMKEETRILLNELKSHFLKLKSHPGPAALSNRQPPSVISSPMLSPRMRLSSEDRAANRESVSKLDIHLHSSTRSFFYQQLFDNFTDDVKKNILDHSIETCENPFERCRLIMLTLSIFSESVTTYGTKLLRSLIELSDPAEKSSSSSSGYGKPPVTNPSISNMCGYANKMLVLDAIPLVLNISPLSNLDVDVDELFERTLNFYSENCIETSATEYEPNELHEGLKKSIAARILGTEHAPVSEEATEEHLIVALNLLGHKIIEILTDVSVKTKFEEFRSIISDKSNFDTKFNRMMDIIRDLDLDIDIPEDVLFASGREETSGSRPTFTPPPKGRGRPKKAQHHHHQQQTVLVSLDEGVKRHLQNKSREVQFVFFSVVQHMFVNCLSYLKSTRSRVLLNFDNPLATHIESAELTELVKSYSQRTSRSKTGSQQSNEEVPVGPAKKKIKLDKTELDRKNSCLNLEESPLNSEQSKMMDSHILTTLIEAHKCLEFLNSNFGVFTKLWQKFLTSNHITELEWYRRLSVDSMLMSEQYDNVSELLESIFEKNKREDPVIKKEQSNLEISTLTIMPGSPAVSVADLRREVQLISCYVQRLDKIKTFHEIDEIITKMKQCGLLINDEGYSSGNIIDEYMVTVQHEGQNNLGFLFFDSLSLIRYCIDILLDVLRRYTTTNSLPSDTALGHAIVLSQFDWPKESRTYDRCINWLRIHKPKSTTPQCLSASTKFTYPQFFNYVRNPNIVEDFMAMLSQGYTLDIKGSNTSNYLSSTSPQARTGNSTGSSIGGSRSSSNSSTTRSGKVITTRGVNKTFKEDLKVAMVAQMRNSSALIPLDVISEFIQASLIPFLSSVKK